MLKLGCGKSTNTRVELLALWGLLYFAEGMGLPELQVYVDSKIISDWINDVVVLSVLELDYWCSRVKSLRLSFNSFSFQHTYREHNHIADGILKDAIYLSCGQLSLQKFMEYSLFF